MTIHNNAQQVHPAADDGGQDFRAEGALSTSAPKAEAAVRAAFNAWVTRTRLRFAPSMGSVEESFRLWKEQYPQEVRSAIASATGERNV